MALSGTRDAIYVYDSQTLALTRKIEPVGFIGDAAFSPDGTLLAVSVAAPQDFLVRLYRTSDWRLVRSLGQETSAPSPVYSLSFLDGQTLGAATASSGLYAWRLSDGTLLRATPSLSATFVLGTVFSPDGEHVAYWGGSAGENIVRLWRVSDGTLLKTLTTKKAVLSAAFSPDGRTLATGDSVAVQVWRVSDGTLLLTLSMYNTAVAFSPDGKVLATAELGPVLRLWRVGDGALLCTLHVAEEQSRSIWFMKFSPDGRILASQSDDSIARLWGVTRP